MISFDFGAVLAEWPLLAKGVGVTVALTAVSATVGVTLGVACAWSRLYGAAWLRAVVGTYVELIRNTPFIVQLFFVFFGLPGLGVKLSAESASVLAMVINLGAYACEIVRAGIATTPRGQIEAARSLALTEMSRAIARWPSARAVTPGTNTATAHYGVSDQGTLVHVATRISAQAQVRTLVWVDRNGGEEAIPAPPRAYLYPRISPDGMQVALDVRDQENDIWIWSVARRTLTRLTFDPGLDRYPVWRPLPDGRGVRFRRGRGGPPNLFLAGRGWHGSGGAAYREHEHSVPALDCRRRNMARVRAGAIGRNRNPDQL